MNKRILLINYYWPPAGGGGVQRWLKMSKYLPRLGYDLIVYTPENGEAPVIDESLLDEINPSIEILKQPIWEPYGWYKKLTGRKKGEKVYSGFISDKGETFMQKLSVFIRGNFFIPDARKFWIKPSVKFLRKYLKEHPVNVIISTGPPHSMHLIALGVTKKINVPWVADFRDPWTNIDFYDQLRLTKWGDQKHRSLELKVLKNATKIVTVSKSWAASFKEICGRNDIELITNGYDEADFKDTKNEVDKKFTICHIGSMNKDRDPGKLWQAIAELLDEKVLDDICIRLIGQVDHQIFQSLELNGLLSHIDHKTFMPHDLVVKELGKNAILLLPINDTPNSAGVIPGKIFEYLGSQRPVLGIGPTDCDSALILEETKAGVMINYDDLNKMKLVLADWYKEHVNGSISIQNSNIKKYSREALAGQYDRLIRTL